ncbi:helix-turn-helix transcriptional regulator [Anaeromyxobacter oryzae]|uniref:HTH cro/C1-type domain-containing protein n=1 Tax=Anaeromyxobacter oryzae TaxID=2918170 RepID=A0ABN6MVN3_9BACT|nr:helix-turn-helix transcriptional regulator [Anaeromyxobacter oryzae]BDG04988.1 hypothetical protein AMOR_39840 [Anaeromyxobacter oryzae]
METNGSNAKKRPSRAPAVKVGVKLRERRAALSLSQMQLAVMSGIALNTLQRAEAGDFTYRTAVRLAPHLDLAPADLLPGVKV